MSVQETILQVAALGMDVEAFLNSAVGRYLQGRAAAEIQEGLQALKTVDPANPNQIREFQNRVYRGEKFLDWLEEAIQEGQNAERMAMQEEP